MKCTRCFDSGNEGDIGFFIPCKNGCEDLHHDWLKVEEAKSFALRHQLKVGVLNGELVFHTGVFPKEKCLGGISESGT